MELLYGWMDREQTQGPKGTVSGPQDQRTVMGVLTFPLEGMESNEKLFKKNKQKRKKK